MDLIDVHYLFCMLQHGVWHQFAWLVSSALTSVPRIDVTNLLFCFLPTAMHLFGLNWHLQPMQRQMYQLTEDNTSGLPLPTDLGLPPLGNTGLELPDRRGKDDGKEHHSKLLLLSDVPSPLPPFEINF